MCWSVVAEMGSLNWMKSSQPAEGLHPRDLTVSELSQDYR